MSVRNSHSIPEEPISVGKKTTRQVLIGPDEGPNFSMRVFTIQPDGEMPNHTNTVEHEQYVLQGTAEIGIGKEVFTVGKGDIVFIPAGIPHWYRTLGNESFKFLCLIPNLNDEITIIK